LQADDLQTGLGQLIIGMVTSNLIRKGHKSRIFVDINTKTGKHSGLLSNSVIMTDNVATVRLSEIYKKIGFGFSQTSRYFFIIKIIKIFKILKFSEFYDRTFLYDKKIGAFTDADALKKSLKHTFGI